MDVRARLKERGLELPPAVAPIASFVPWSRVGAVVHLSGHIARRDGKPWTGKLGRDVGVPEGQDAARAAVLEALGTLGQALEGDWNRLRRIVRIAVFVNVDPVFTESHVVANGASDLLVDVFGQAGEHARTTVGVAQLPLGACVEVELVAELTSAVSEPPR
jgi:enamine deaminase RidA (YjgF/YER057c/UK114 family)